LIFDALHHARLGTRSDGMSDLIRWSDEQMAKLSHFFPKSHGRPRVDDGDDGQVLSEIFFINRSGTR
jgi:hypothetical protein